MNDRVLPAAIAADVCAHFECNFSFTFAGWRHAQSMIWRAESRGRRPVYVKVHAVPYLYARHLNAFVKWVPLLHCRTPELLYCNEQNLVMVFGELPGVTLEEATISAKSEREAYETAGRIAREFHEIPADGADGADRPMDAAEALRERMERFLASSEDRLSAGTAAWVKRVVPETERFSDEAEVPCHRDYSPRNWLVSETDQGLIWSLIDFERARQDLKYVDFQRMWFGAWDGRPDLRGAFFGGYGRDLSADELYKLKLFVLITTLGTIPWAEENGDPEFGEWALACVERLRREW